MLKPVPHAGNIGCDFRFWEVVRDPLMAGSGAKPPIWPPLNMCRAPVLAPLLLLRHAGLHQHEPYRRPRRLRAGEAPRAEGGEGQGRGPAREPGTAAVGEDREASSRSVSRERPCTPTTAAPCTGSAAKAQTPPRGFHGKPVNSTLRSISAKVQAPAKPARRHQPGGRNHAASAGGTA